MTQLRMSAAEYRQLMDKPQSKYRNVKTVVDDITFDSKAEANRYCELKMLLASGEICGFGRQPSFVLPGGIRYRPDFIVCGKDGEIWVEDVKGMLTEKFKIKQKLWRQAYAWLPLKVVR